MVTEDNHVVHSPTVSHVIEEFIVAIRADAGVPDDGIDRLEKLLHKGAVPKPDDITAALFKPPPDTQA